jgi:hypothetical protein
MQHQARPFFHRRPAPVDSTTEPDAHLDASDRTVRADGRRQLEHGTDKGGDTQRHD